MSVQMESFHEAWQNLASQGLGLTRASFEIGWELVHLANAAQPTHAASEDADILKVDDLSGTDRMQVRIERIGAALWYFKNPQSQRPAAEIPPVSIDALKSAVTNTGNVAAEAANFHLAVVKACAALDGTPAATQPGAAPAVINGLKEAYEVGRLLGAIVLNASEAKDQARGRGNRRPPRLLAAWRPEGVLPECGGVFRRPQPGGLVALVGSG